MNHTTRVRLLAATAASALALVGATAIGSPADAKQPKLVTGHLLAFNDFHGNIDPPTGSGGMVLGTPAGGVEYLATAIKTQRAADRATTPYVFTVAAGDIIGASPLVSAAFHDEPAIEEMNSLGLDVTSVGNHEFDEGVTELLRMQNGGCHPTDGCQDGDGFAGANYPILAANVVRKSDGQPILPAFTIKKVGNVKVAFVGMTLEGTPSIVNPAGITTVNFLDEADTANFYAGLLRESGVRSLVLLLHEGGFQNPPVTVPPTPSDPNACLNFGGAVKEIVSHLDPAYGVVVSGHTHQAYICDLPNSSGADTLVTSAGSFGTQLTDVTFTLDQAKKKFVSASAHNSIVVRQVKDGPAKAIADKYRTAVAPIANRVVGRITADITRTVNAAQETALGDVIADGMIAYTQASAGAQIALMNPGGIRADLTFVPTGGEAPGEVTFGEAFTVQPFNNLVVTVTLTGAQLKTVLEQQFMGFMGQLSTKFLQVSAGFTYSYNTTLPLGSRISDLKLNGVAIDPAAPYRVTTNDFVANGGDGFTSMRAATNRVTAPLFDVDSLAAYLGTHAPVAPGPQNRITKLG
jgi:5'-nucleotidase